MFALIGGLFGFLTSSLPSVLDYFRGIRDNQHELALIDKQIEFQKLNIGMELKETAVSAELAQMQMAYTQAAMSSGTKWIDGLNGLIRPIIALTLLALYLLVKLPLIYMQFENFENGYMVDGLWTDHDNTILGMIVGFFFGRSLNL